MSFREKMMKYIDKYRNLLRMMDENLPISDEITTIKTKQNERPDYTANQTFFAYFKMYKENEARCAICHINNIFYSSWYPISKKTDGENRQMFDLDHMKPFSANGSNSVVDNVVPVCKLCNTAKGKMVYDDFLVVYCVTKKLFDKCIIDTNNEAFKIVNDSTESELSRHILRGLAKLMCKNFAEISVAIDKIKKNEVIMYYSDFINSTMMSRAKYNQCLLVKQWFMRNIGFEPINDLVFYNGDIYLTAYSENKIYGYGETYSWHHDISNLCLRNTLTRLMELSEPIYNLEELLYEHQRNDKILNLSDFLVATYKDPEHMINESIKMIKETHNLDVRINKDISYSMFSNPLVSAGFADDKVVQMLKMCGEQFVMHLGWEPSKDVPYNNGIIVYNGNVPNIHLINFME